MWLRKKRGLCMSNIRDFHLVQKKEDASLDFSQKIKQHKRNGFVRTLLTILAITVVVILIYIQYQNQVFTKISSTSKVNRPAVVENASFLQCQDNMVTYSKDGISCFDSKGKVLWNMTYEMQNPIVRISGGIVACCDYNGHIVYVIDDKGKISQIDTNLPIRNMNVSKQKNVVAILEDASNAWVNLFDASGNKLVEAKATMTKTGYPLTAALSGEVMGVSYFYVDSSTMKSSVTFYNFGGVGENQSDHIVSSYDYADAVVPTLEYLDDENLFAVADNRLMFFSGNQKPTGSADILLTENIVGIYSGNQSVGLVFYGTDGKHKYRLDLYGKDGKKKMSYDFDMDFKDIIIQNEQVVIYNESHICLVGMNGKEKLDTLFEENIIYLQATDSKKKFVAISEDSILSLQLE